MEAFGQDYESIMSMPCGRRRRLCDEKVAMDQRRSANNKMTASHFRQRQLR